MPRLKDFKPAGELIGEFGGERAGLLG